MKKQSYRELLNNTEEAKTWTCLDVTALWLNLYEREDTQEAKTKPVKYKRFIRLKQEKH